MKQAENIILKRKKENDYRIGIKSIFAIFKIVIENTRLMDYKESYIELLETNKRLEKELELIRSKSQEKTEIVRETIFRNFSLCILFNGNQQVRYWSVC